jgi:hypothetical protein
MSESDAGVDSYAIRIIMPEILLNTQNLPCMWLHSQGKDIPTEMF